MKACNEKQQPAPAQKAEDILAAHRRRIDSIDSRILELLSQRALCALEIARGKENGKVPLFSASRESDVIESALKQNRGPLPDESLRGIFVEIISACRALQGPMRIAFLGPEFTFSHQAAHSRFGSSSSLLPLASIEDVFQEVERGHSQLGVVPVENSSEGGVGTAMDRFRDTDLKVCGEIFLPISQVLMSTEKSMGAIKVVYSHPQALAQTTDWLRRNLPGVDAVEVSSTSAAADRASREPGSAAVASRLAAEALGLNVIAGDIQDNPNNVTRFFIICQHSCPPTGNDKTSLLFHVRHKPNALYQALGSISDCGLNLTRIESRPTKNRPWEYAFYVDFLGHQEDGNARRALAALAEEVEDLKVLGSYPVGEQVFSRKKSNKS